MGTREEKTDKPAPTDRIAQILREDKESFRSRGIGLEPGSVLKCFVCGADDLTPK
jgi:hypothetical protein